MASSPVNGPRPARGIAFSPVVVLERGVPEGLVPRIDPVTGEGPGSLLDVVLGVIADAEGEEFHQLPGKVFVRMILLALSGIQPDEHRRVARDGLYHQPEIGECMLAERLVLLPHEIAVRGPSGRWSRNGRARKASSSPGRDWRSSASGRATS